MQGYMLAAGDTSSERCVPRWYLEQLLKYENRLSPVLTVVGAGELPFLCYMLFHTSIILQRKRMLFLHWSATFSKLSNDLLPVIMQSRSHIYLWYSIVQGVTWGPYFFPGKPFQSHGSEASVAAQNWKEQYIMEPISSFPLSKSISGCRKRKGYVKLLEDI